MDRNLFFVHVLEGSIRSLSARRAWIEIYRVGDIPLHIVRVALRKESVDRNQR